MLLDNRTILLFKLDPWEINEKLVCRVDL